jgi:hypothetical protein
MKRTRRRCLRTRRRNRRRRSQRGGAPNMSGVGQSLMGIGTGIAGVGLSATQTGLSLAQGGINMTGKIGSSALSATGNVGKGALNTVGAAGQTMTAAANITKSAARAAANITNKTMKSSSAIVGSAANTASAMASTLGRNSASIVGSAGQAAANSAASAQLINKSIMDGAARSVMHAMTPVGDAFGVASAMTRKSLLLIQGAGDAVGGVTKFATNMIADASAKREATSFDKQKESLLNSAKTAFNATVNEKIKALHMLNLSQADLAINTAKDYIRTIESQQCLKKRGWFKNSYNCTNANRRINANAKTMMGLRRELQQLVNQSIQDKQKLFDKEIDSLNSNIMLVVDEYLINAKEANTQIDNPNMTTTINNKQQSMMSPRAIAISNASRNIRKWFEIPANKYLTDQSTAQQNKILRTYQNLLREAGRIMGDSPGPASPEVQAEIAKINQKAMTTSTEELQSQLQVAEKKVEAETASLNANGGLPVVTALPATDLPVATALPGAAPGE